MNIIDTASPNFNARKSDVIDMLILHYTDLKTVTESLDILTSPKMEVSAHYLIDEDGTVHQIVDEENRAWHAGKSYWRDITDVNSHSIGIEIQNPGHSNGYRAFPTLQMDSVLELCTAIIKRHPTISAQNIIAHSDIAPDRKSDPGELFNWALLAKNGIGEWPSSTKAITDNHDLHKDLIAYGYNPNLDLETLTRAFQRHFEPAVFEKNQAGIPTKNTHGLLRQLLNAQ